MLFRLQEEMTAQELTRRLATVVTHVDEIMQQEVRPLVAVDIIEQLHRQFAILSGGRGKDGAPIITFPEFVGFKRIPEEDFLNVLTYLTSIPSVEAASIGFVIVIDRRRDKWSSIKASLTRIAVAFPGNLQLIFILRPLRLIQRAFTDIGIKYYRDEFKMKVPIIMLNSVSDLHDYIDKSQLTRELGGTLEYRHSQWINHRTAIENFALTLKTTAQMLQTFGACLAMTDLPKGMLSTEDLLMSHTRQQDKMQDELKSLEKQGATLLSCVQQPTTQTPISKLNPNELENVATMERLLVQLEETKKAFSQFWTEHHLKLNQCLQLQRFEHNYSKVKLALDNLREEQAEFTAIGDSVMHVEQLLKEHKKLEEKGQESLEKAQLLALAGDQLIQSRHYAVEYIWPRCVELRHLCDDFINENKKKYDILGKSLELHKQLDKVSRWCEEGIYLLASQAVDKCQSREGIDVALSDIETFLSTAKEYQLLSPKEFYNQFELILTLDVKAKAQKVLQKLADVQEIFHKRQVSLMKLAAKQTRPVQPVAPHPESSPKWVSPKTSQPSALAPPQRTTEEPHVQEDLNSLEKEDDETKLDTKNEVVERSHSFEGTCGPRPPESEDLSPNRVQGPQEALPSPEQKHRLDLNSGDLSSGSHPGFPAGDQQLLVSDSIFEATFLFCIQSALGRALGRSLPPADVLSERATDPVAPRHEMKPAVTRSRRRGFATGKGVAFSPFLPLAHFPFYFSRASPPFRRFPGLSGDSGFRPEFRAVAGRGRPAGSRGGGRGVSLAGPGRRGVGGGGRARRTPEAAPLDSSDPDPPGRAEAAPAPKPGANKGARAGTALRSHRASGRRAARDRAGKGVRSVPGPSAHPRPPPPPAPAPGPLLRPRAPAGRAAGRGEAGRGEGIGRAQRRPARDLGHHRPVQQRPPRFRPDRGRGAPPSSRGPWERPAPRAAPARDPQSSECRRVRREGGWLVALRPGLLGTQITKGADVSPAWPSGGAAAGPLKPRPPCPSSGPASRPDEKSLAAGTKLAGFKCRREPGSQRRLGSRPRGERAARSRAGRGRGGASPATAGVPAPGRPRGPLRRPAPRGAGPRPSWGLPEAAPPRASQIGWKPNYPIDVHDVVELASRGEEDTASVITLPVVAACEKGAWDSLYSGPCVPPLEVCLAEHHRAVESVGKRLSGGDNQKRIIHDLIETEEVYITEIKSIIDGYIIPMDFMWLKHLIPDVLQNSKDILFGNIKELYEFHSRIFLKELENCTENPNLLACCFLKRKEDLQMYFEYHKNLPRARAIWQECQNCAYFGVCQRQLGHSLPLFKYLKGPSQRLIKYQMLLKGLLDLESPEDAEVTPGDLQGALAKDAVRRTTDSTSSVELQQALAVIEDLIKSCELAVDLTAVSGCPDDIGKLGKLLMHSQFSVWTVHKDRSKVKDFIRFKPSQRQIYLFERGIVFCKIRMEPGDQGSSPRYSFKKSMKLVTLSVRLLGRGSNKKFEITSRNGPEKYILQASSKEIRDCWFSEISKLLLEQQNNIKACPSSELVCTERSDGGDGAGAMEKESSALSLSGLFELDDSCETCGPSSVLVAVEGGAERGREREGDRAAEDRRVPGGGGAPGLATTESPGLAPLGVWPSTAPSSAPERPAACPGLPARQGATPCVPAATGCARPSPPEN
ncbi:putative guanine nucleotide exchange factor MCF2L2 [Ctenodactylus gundi]